MPIANRIKKLEVKDGNVLIENVLIDDDAVLLKEYDSKVWPGIRGDNDLAKSYASRLLEMSSHLPERNRRYALKMGYYLAKGSKMLYPGAQPEIINLGIVLTAATRLMEI